MIWIGLLKRRSQAPPAYSDDAAERANVREEYGQEGGRDVILLMPHFLEAGEQKIEERLCSRWYIFLEAGK
jgi:hypothetical protein